MTEPVAEFLREAALNLLRITEKAAAALPREMPPPRPFQIEVPGPVQGEDARRNGAAAEVTLGESTGT